MSPMYSRAGVFFFKQKPAYEIVDCDWSSDVCSSDLAGVFFTRADRNMAPATGLAEDGVELSATAQAVANAANSREGALDTPNPLGEIVLGNADAPVTIVEYASLTCSQDRKSVV